MALYLDTSALAKLYIEEDDRNNVVAAIEASDLAMTSTIAYVETRSALARKLREGVLDVDRHQRAVTDLNEDWPTFAHLDVTEPLTFLAGELTRAYALRGYDAVHLATALGFAEDFAEMEFLSFDKKLNNAARLAGLSVYGGESRGDADEGR